MVEEEERGAADAGGTQEGPAAGADRYRGAVEE